MFPRRAALDAFQMEVLDVAVDANRVEDFARDRIEKRLRQVKVVSTDKELETAASSPSTVVVPCPIFKQRRKLLLGPIQCPFIKVESFAHVD